MPTTRRKSKRKAAEVATAAMASACAVESEEDEIPEFVDDHSSSDSDSESENESEDEDILHGPCGGKVCGADPPPPALRTFIGQFVAKEFQLDDEELPTLYWGQVTQYLQDTKKFCVSTVLSHFLPIFFFYKTFTIFRSNGLMTSLLSTNAPNL